MSPVWSIYVDEVWPRAAALTVTAVEKPPEQLIEAASLIVTRDFALQLLLEAFEGRPVVSLPLPPDEAGILAHLCQLRAEKWTFDSAAVHYISGHKYAVSSRDSLTLLIIGRFPWLFAGLRPGMFWESAAWLLNS